jgi:hypothetical protein
MPPKRGKSSPSSLKNAQVSERQKNALSNMFRRIESSDSLTKTCPRCNEQVKSCLFADHSRTKCKHRSSSDLSTGQDEVLILEELSTKKRSCSSLTSTQNKRHGSEAKKELVKQEEAKENLIVKTESATGVLDEQVLAERDTKRCKIEQIQVQESSSQILNEFMDRINEGSLEPIRTNPDLESLNSHDSVGEVKCEPAEAKIDYYLLNFTNALEAVLSEKTFCCLLDASDYETIDRFSSLSSKIN